MSFTARHEVTTLLGLHASIVSVADGHFATHVVTHRDCIYSKIRRSEARQSRYRDTKENPFHSPSRQDRKQSSFFGSCPHSTHRSRWEKSEQAAWERQWDRKYLYTLSDWLHIDVLTGHYRIFIDPITILSLINSALFDRLPQGTPLPQ